MTQEQSGQPWYREFWAWFVLAPLITSVVVSSLLLSTAIRFGDDELTDDYYKKGRMINQSLEQVERAAAMGLVAELKFDLELGDLTLAFTNVAEQPQNEQMTLFLDHPISEDLDRVLVLRRFAPGNYRADLDYRLNNRWYLRLLPDDQTDPALAAEDSEPRPDQWRLNGEIDFSAYQAVVLQAP